MSARTKKKTDELPPVWGETWRGSWFTRPLAWCALAWCAGALAWKLAIPLHWVILAAVVATALAPMIATGLGEPLRGRWLHGVLWATVGAYVTWLVADTPLQRDVFLAWLPAGGLLGAWWWWVRARAAEDARRGLDVQAQARQDAERGMWVEMLERVLKKKPGTSGIVELARTPFPAGASYGSTIRLGLPRDGSIPYSRLEGTVEQLEHAADARVGSLLFERDTEHGAQALLHVMERNALTETSPLPFDRGPKSIHDPVELGRYADGQVVLLTWRQVAAMLVGLRGSGKSNLIHVNLAHLTGCVDAVVWGIDLKGGETMLPWIEAALEDPTVRPAIDWVATTEAEAEAMLVAINAAIRGRRGYTKPSRETPSIVLIVDEASLVTGVGKYANVKRAGLLQDFVNTGRSRLCEGLVCSQRATVTMLGNGDMVSNLDVRIGMGVTDRTEAAMILPDGAWSAALARIPTEKQYRGSFLMQDLDAPRLMPAKAHSVTEDLIPGMAVTNAQYRPDLDAETVEDVEAALSHEGVSGGYAARWDRLRETLGYPSHGPSQGASHPQRETPPGPSQGAVSETPASASQLTRGERLVQDEIDKDRAERDRLKFEQIVSGEFDPETGAWRETPADVMADLPPGERADPDVIPPILRHLVRIFGDSDQLPTAFILESLPGGQDETTRMTPKAFSVLMAHCGVASVENVKDAAGKRVRGYVRADVYRAVDRARRGGMPEAAFSWEP